LRYDIVVEGRAATPGGLREVQVGVDNGTIRRITNQGLEGERRIRAGKRIVFPGFIDCHVHLREPGWEHKEDFKTGTRAAAHGGVTTVLDMPNNKVPVTDEALLERKSAAAKKKGVVDIKLFAGLTGENLGHVARMGTRAVGFKAYLAKSTGGIVFPMERLGDVMREVGAIGKTLSVHCEDPGVLADAARSARKGDFASLRPPLSETRAVDAVLAEAGRAATGTQLNVCHASLAMTLSQVKSARAEGIAVTCEATLHHLYFSSKSAAGNPFLRTNPPIRGEHDREALVAGVRDGGVDLLVTDHAPHTEEEKSSVDPPSGVPGLDNFSNVVSWLIAKVGVEPTRIAEVACSGPAKTFGLSDRGELAVGKRADMTVIDLRAAETVTRDSLETKCGWSPYEGVTFPGRATWTVRGGKVLLEDGVLL